MKTDRIAVDADKGILERFVSVCTYNTATAGLNCNVGSRIVV